VPCSEPILSSAPLRDDRLAKLEAESAELFRRFKAALLGYLILAAAVIVAFFVLAHTIHRVERDEQAIEAQAKQLRHLVCDANPQVRRVLAAQRLCEELAKAKARSQTNPNP
jgi:hypothetical protein